MTAHADRAVVSGARRRSCETIYDRASRAAAGLVELGAGVGSSVAILMRNAIEFLEASRAASLAGSYPVPLNWHLAPGEIAYVLQDCDAVVLIIHRDLIGALPADVLENGKFAIIVVDTPEESLAAYGAAKTDLPLPRRALQWEQWIAAQAPIGNPSAPRDSIIYTSGTTGHPKGVKRAPATDEQRVAINRMRTDIYFLTEGIRQIIPAPLYHGAPNIFANRALDVADLVVLMPKFDPEDFLRLVQTHRITHAVMVPTMFVRLLRLSEEVRRSYDISSLKVVLHAAAPCPPDVKAEMIKWFGPIILEWYGTTETSAVTLCSTEEWKRFPGTVGKAIPGATIRILDEDDREVPAGREGEVYMILDFMPHFTYHKRDADRARIDRGGLVTGGDIGYLNEEGYLFICDRKKDMVISGGVNIYPAEIESVLIGMKGVQDCAVIGVPDPEYGEALLALVVAESSVTEDGIRAHLAPALAGYKVPRKIEFRPSLPRDDVGKILKRRLREPYWEKQAGRV